MITFFKKLHPRIFFFLLCLIFGLSFLIAGLIFAASESDIVYPVKELGNCQNETECRTYCDEPRNLGPCLEFAEEYDLISDEELAIAKKFLAAGGTGPGGCASKESCETFCNDVNNIDECVAYGEEHGLLSGAELEEAKKVQAALAKGAELPGGCRNKNECDAYCNDPNHMEECIAFAEAAGFIPPDELEEARKALQAIKKGAIPPPCRGKKECDTYCATPENFEVCIAFAEAAGFVSAEEAAMARKTGGKGPGNCRGRDECERFCEDESNLPICIDFAVEHGMMSEEEAAMAKKTGGKGPGNCKGREECEAFCQDPINQEICFNFAKEHGLISEEDLKMIEEGKQKLMEVLDQAPPPVIECLNDAWGADVVEKIKSGTGMPSRDMGDTIRECYEEMGPPQGMHGVPGEPGGNGYGSPINFDTMPPLVEDCLRSTVGSEVLENIKTGQAPPPPDFGEKMRSCFEQSSFPRPENHEGEFYQGEFEGGVPHISPDDAIPLDEHMEQFIEQQMPQEMQEMQQQMEQQMQQEIQSPIFPSPETEQPQSLLNRAFLGTVIKVLLGIH